MTTTMGRRLLTGLLASAAVLILHSAPVFADCQDAIMRLSRMGVLGDRRAVEEYRAAQASANAGRESECRDHLDRAYSYLQSSGYVDRDGNPVRGRSSQEDRYSNRYDPRYDSDRDRYNDDRYGDSQRRYDDRNRYEGSSNSGGIGDMLQRALRGGNSSQ